MIFCTDPSLGNFDYAEKAFRFIKDPCLFVYNVMIKAFAKRSTFRSVVELFRRLREEGLCPYNFTYPFVLKPLDAWERFGKVKGRFDEALDMFRRMSCESNEKADEVMAGEFVMGIQYNRFNEAVALLQETQTKRVKGDKFTAVALLTGCAPLGALEQGEWIHGYIEYNRIKN
ncbi:hypothetical protein ACFX2I_031506 [Malus domestica]